MWPCFPLFSQSHRSMTKVKVKADVTQGDTYWISKNKNIPNSDLNDSYERVNNFGILFFYLPLMIRQRLVSRHVVAITF
jgi:hypothetical protein